MVCATRFFLTHTDMVLGETSLPIPFPDARHHYGRGGFQTCPFLQ